MKSASLQHVMQSPFAFLVTTGAVIGSWQHTNLYYVPSLESNGRNCRCRTTSSNVCQNAKHYGFTDEELDFIINYDIKYRMGIDRDNE